jgi:hypothetical protein
VDEESCEVCMSRRSRIPASPLFEAAAHRAQFRDRVAIVVRASPEAIFRALRDVTLPDMKLAWLLGEIRYLPSRLSGDEPPTATAKPFFQTVTAGGTLVLHDDAPREVITGSAAQLHRVNQAPRRFASREEFEAFADPEHEKLFISTRIAATGRPGEYWLVLEHATRAFVEFRAQVPAVLARNQTRRRVCQLAAVASGSPTRGTCSGHPGPSKAGLEIGSRKPRGAHTCTGGRRAHSSCDRHADARRGDSTHGA